MPDPALDSRPLSRRLLGFEVLVVVGVAFLGSTLRSVQVLAEYLATRERVPLHAVRIRGHPALDAALQVLVLVGACVPIALVVDVLARSGEALHDLGLRVRPRWRDVGLALGLVAGIFGCSLAAALLTRPLGLPNLQVAAGAGYGTTHIPAVVTAAARAGLVEEVVVCGYLLHRLSQLGWSDGRAVVASVAVRASYHLYGGAPLALLTVFMGVVFARSYQKRRNLTALVLAHFTWDALLLVLAVTTR